MSEMPLLKGKALKKQKQYYKGIEEIEVPEMLQEHNKNEFQEDLPVLDYLNENLKKSQASRRDFLKAMGFSVSAAALAASCEAIPVKKAIPYLNKPENITPGKALYYASTYYDGNDFANILVKTREGRPIKIDGNPNGPIGNAGSTAAIQASVISLYDSNRYKGPTSGGKNKTWAEIDDSVKFALSNSAKPVVLLTNSIISPSIKKAIEAFKAKYSARHVTYDAISASAILKANEKSFGKKVIPNYKFENADIIASFGADFLGNWLSSMEYVQGYMANRKVSADHPKMSKHYQVESYFSLTGSNADERLPLKPSEMKAALFALYNELGGSTGSPSMDAGNGFIKRMAADLEAARGKALVVCGINDEDCQSVTNAINAKLGSYGSTIDLNRTVNAFQCDDEVMAALVSDIKAGNVGALLTYGANPVYSYPDAELAEAIGNITTVIGLDTAPNETNTLAGIQMPTHHYLEDWCDYEYKKGSFSMAQPTINPLYNTRSLLDTLNALVAEDDVPAKSSYRALQETWKEKLTGDFREAWDKLVESGVYHEEDVPAQDVSFDASSAASGISYSGSSSSNGLEFVLYADKLGDGQHAGNPYLQELPDPVSKACWTNYAAVSPKFAKDQGWHKIDRNKKPGKQTKPVIAVTANGQSIELPVLPQPGVPYGVLAIPVGYGRTVGSLAGVNIGANGYKLAGAGNGSPLMNGVATFETTGKRVEIPQTQIHYTIDDDRPVVKEATLADYSKDKNAGNWEIDLPEYKKATDVTLYPQTDYSEQGHHWKMSVDLNSCIGCGACSVACSVENNVPVVGKTEIQNYRDMHWIRIDRYYASRSDDPKDLENPSVVFMPMMCQHCDNAPCENVCPVNATNHSSEGLNQMAYNRCIGTRYCANNCPYKVRRFNWLDYWGADWIDGNDLNKDEVSGNMRGDLTRMVLNPDVTVRSRGVIEKCSFCVQRIQEAKLEAKMAGEPMAADAVKTACQTACPTNAIVFGDNNNPESEVHKLLQNDRSYRVLDEFHVLPSVEYLTKITNAEHAPFDKLDEGFYSREAAGAHGKNSEDDHKKSDH